MDGLLFAILGTVKGRGYVDPDGRGVFIPAGDEPVLPVGSSATFIGMQLEGRRRRHRSLYVSVTRYGRSTPGAPVLIFFVNQPEHPFLVSR